MTREVNFDLVCPRPVAGSASAAAAVLVSVAVTVVRLCSGSSPDQEKLLKPSSMFQHGWLERTCAVVVVDGESGGYVAYGLKLVIKIGTVRRDL